MINGLGIGLGLLLFTCLFALLEGWPAAIVACSGFGCACVADGVCAPRQKWSAMWPAALNTVFVAALVVASQGNPTGETVVILGVVFFALLWTAWGKRGMPQSFAMILSLIFQISAFAVAPLQAGQGLAHVAWVAVGAFSVGCWAWLCAMVLAPRYRTLALADSIAQLSRLIEAQSRWTQDLAQAQNEDVSTPKVPTETDLVPLIRQQAALADVFQSARDLLYEGAGAGQNPQRSRQINSLIELINLRDATLACQIDLESLQREAGAQPLLQWLALWLAGQATHLQRLAEALRLGTEQPEPTALPDAPGTDSPRLEVLVHRALHLQEYRAALDAALRSPNGAHTWDEALLRTLISPTHWSLTPLRRQLHPRAPVLRYALRTTLAMGCALAVNHLLPWHVHPHWLLLTVAVVMRGNLEQTLARRDARIQGTIAGCVLAMLLLTLGPPTWLLLVVMALSLSFGHANLQRNYRLTAAAAAVMALIQVHFFAHDAQPAWRDAVIRLLDTFLGAGIAWGFSYVLPSWERGQWPALVARLRQAHLQHAQHALQWEHDRDANVHLSHARREVYDVIWLLAQALQRADKEPAYARSHSPQIEDMLIRSHRLVSHLAAVRMLLTRRHADLPEAPTRVLLQRSTQRVGSALQHETTTACADTHHPVTPPRDDTTDGDLVTELPSPLIDPSPWLQRRLSLIQAEAHAWAHSAQGFRPAH